MRPLPPGPESNRPVPRAFVLGLRIDALPRIDAVERAVALTRGERAAHLVTANSLMAIEAEHNRDLRTACAEADLSVADSSGLTWAARALGEPALERFPGVDVAFELCHRAAENGTPVFLLGGALGVADRAGRHLVAAIPGLRVAGSRDGFFHDGDEAAIISAIAESGAKVVLVALGMPRQELWIYRNKARLPAGLYIGVGGTFDIWAGMATRAPLWVQDMGFEWLFRLVQEPWRLRRMLGLPLFAWRVLRESKADR